MCETQHTLGRAKSRSPLTTALDVIMDNSYIYKLKIKHILYFSIIIFIPALYFYETPQFILVAFIFISFNALIAWIATTVVINDNGIKMYLLNKTTYTNIKSITKQSVLGLPYLTIIKSKGLNWSLPLYLTGNIPIKDALLSTVPKEMDIYEQIKNI